MAIHKNKTPENGSFSTSPLDSEADNKEKTNSKFVDNRPESQNQKQLQEAADNSSQSLQLKQLQSAANNSPQVKETVQRQEMANDHLEKEKSEQKTTQLKSGGNAGKVVQRALDENADESLFPEGVSEDYRKVKDIVLELLGSDRQKLAFMLRNQKYVFKAEKWIEVSVKDYEVTVKKSDELDFNIGTGELWEKPADMEITGPNKFAIIAHRGRGPTSHLSGKGSESNGKVPEEMAPENTMKAFEESFSQGADGFELDVYVTADGIPVVIHDDELNRNVEGADRGDTNLGFIEKMSFAETQQFNVGHGEKIPRLIDVLVKAKEENEIRNQFGLRNLVINIELKGRGAAAKTGEVVAKAVKDKLINHEDVTYCSFHHEEFTDLRENHEEAQITPGIKTALTFGQENVQTQYGWFVPPDKKMREEAKEVLTKLNEEHKFIGFDAPMWDIDGEMVNLAAKLGLQLHASTSNFRNLEENSSFIDFLLVLSERVLEGIYFKTDEPAQARKLMDQYAANRERLKSFGLLLGQKEKGVVERLIKPGTADRVAKALAKAKKEKKDTPK